MHIALPKKSTPEQPYNMDMRTIRIRPAFKKLSFALWGLAGIAVTAEAIRSYDPITISDEACALPVIEAGSGVPVVTIHGLNGFSDDIVATIHSTLSTQCRSIVVDRYGHGACALPDPYIGTLAWHAQAIVGLLDSLNIPKAVIVGHSLGGAIALALAVDHPERIERLVLIAPLAYPPNPLATPAGHLGQWLVKRFRIDDGPLAPIAATIARNQTTGTFYPQLVPWGYYERRSPVTLSRPQLYAAFGDMAQLRNCLRRLAAHYRDIAIPTTILAGDSDQVLNYRDHALRLSQEIPGAEFMLLKGAGHQVNYARPKTVVAAILQQVKKVEGAHAH